MLNPPQHLEPKPKMSFSVLDPSMKDPIHAEKLNKHLTDGSKDPFTRQDLLSISLYWYQQSTKLIKTVNTPFSLIYKVNEFLSLDSFFC